MSTKSARKTIVITGGSDGLGKAIAAALAPQHRVVILSPNEEKLQKTAAELGCEYQVCDVRDYAQVQKAVDQIGPIDCLVNNAGLWIQGPLSCDEPARIQEVIDVNTIGTIYMSKAVISGMQQRKSGLIINVISQGGLYAKADRAVYNASKWAITGFTKSLQPELAPYGIAVTGLYPGKMKTDMFKKMGIEKDMKDGIDPAVVAQTVAFIISLDAPACIPELGIKHMEG